MKTAQTKTAKENEVKTKMEKTSVMGAGASTTKHFKYDKKEHNGNPGQTITTMIT